jgi:hypothetical protein
MWTRGSTWDELLLQLWRDTMITINPIDILIIEEILKDIKQKEEDQDEQ